MEEIDVLTSEVSNPYRINTVGELSGVIALALKGKGVSNPYRINTVGEWKEEKMNRLIEISLFQTPIV